MSFCIVSRLPCRIALLALAGLLALDTGRAQATAAGAPVRVWQTWEATLRSVGAGQTARADPVVQVNFRGPAGQILRGRGFRDDAGIFKVRFAFPQPGRWTWTTECADKSDVGLHARSGTVEVAPYTGDNPLYRHGRLRVSDDRRHLAHADGTPFLWIGDTAWLAYLRASQAEWERWVRDRRARGFTVLLTSCSVTGDKSDRTDRDGNAPFAGPGSGEPNPAFWRNIDRKVRFANEHGLVVCVTGTVKGRWAKQPEADVIRFNEYLAARFAGYHVVISPEQDWGSSPPVAVALHAAEAIHRAAPGLLVTQHPMRRPMPALVLDNFHRPAAIDFVGVQTGIGAAPDGTPVNLADATRATIEWIAALCAAAPRKPVVNLEGVYDDGFEWDAPGAATEMARRGAWYSFLSGACGFTSSTYGLWAWGGTVQFGKWSKPVNLETALNRPYATALGHVATVLRGLEWWKLEPHPEAIANQPDDWARRLAFARTPTGDLALAYLPDNEAIALDATALARVTRVRWFNPRTGTFTAASRVGPLPKRMTFSRPFPGDGVLVLDSAPAQPPIKGSERPSQP